MPELPYSSDGVREVVSLSVARTQKLSALAPTMLVNIIIGTCTQCSFRGAV